MAGSSTKLTLCGSAVFLDFTETRGRPVDRFTAWTTDALCLCSCSPTNPPER